MSTKKLLSAALVTGSMFVAGLASASALVTLNPQAQNGLGVPGVIDAATASFTTIGLQSNLYSSLVINGNSGTQGFSETGTINVTSFFDAVNNTIASNVGPLGHYQINGAFTLSGTGSWSGVTYNANPGALAFSVALTAVSATANTINLGTLTLAPGPAAAFAIAFGSLAPNSAGSAITSLFALMNFTPAAGTTGAGGFFESPIPFKIDFAIGNAGGNTFNTAYNVDAAGKVTIVTPSPCTTTPGCVNNPGTANITFVTVPEPGVLSLAGIALLGLAFVGKKRKASVAA